MNLLSNYKIRHNIFELCRKRLDDRWLVVTPNLSSVVSGRSHLTIVEHHTIKHYSLVSKEFMERLYDALP